MSYNYRYLQNNLGRKLADLSVLFITGARRTGKSTLAKKLLSEWGGNQYFSFDTPEEKLLFKNDPVGFIQNLKFPVVLDEIQNIPEIFPYIKSLVDKKGFSQIEIILTGSQNFQIMNSASESLAGRVLIKELYPFCLGEKSNTPVQQVKENFLNLIQGREIEHFPNISQNLNQLILNGGYPSITNELTNNDRITWLKSYTQTYIERDVRDLLSIKDLSIFQNFITLVANRTGKLINYSELGKDLGVNYKTVQNYLSVLANSYLWQNLPAYSKQIEKRIVKARKGVLLDSGLASYLNGVFETNSLELSPMRDFLFETFVISEITKLSKIFLNNAKLYHFRLSDNQEVDLVLEYEGKQIPIEIKNSATFKKEWLQGINKFNQLTNNITGHSFIFSRLDQYIKLSENVTNIPVPRFFGF